MTATLQYSMSAQTFWPSANGAEEATSYPLRTSRNGQKDLDLFKLPFKATRGILSTRSLLAIQHSNKKICSSLLRHNTILFFGRRVTMAAITVISGFDTLSRLLGHFPLN